MAQRREADEREIARLRGALRDAETSADLLRKVASDLSAQVKRAPGGCFFSGLFWPL